ncbi:helix-turn-helix transcriptional regulator [Enterovibrio norvegicus FF-162]|uniref:Helix-turn-helix transcriptional regulator n=1 Tax=Enterovibrio norvegicus FF-454 TaxID=1185651 RepID=A0A1E5C2K5_9GAMM|nr:LuxR C-terminal-related transcriptional regulator [Enterovibrio norvegicus]OEE59392.1 helix-turn-helix transcriptional regulator [Enterovibrio norvegicus FF-454]OEE86776.1 helix-turn-helix transcriptional regulator [Enterovibrio norvegicus FF-162]
MSIQTSRKEQKVVVFGQVSLQNAALAQVICNKLNLTIVSCISELNDESKPTLVLVDFSTDKTALSCLKVELEQCPALCKVILLNVDKDSEYNAFLSWPFVVGTFKPSDTLEFLVAGIEKIIVGEIWISRELSTQLIHHFRGYREKKRLVIGDLTVRQRQILNMIANGYSNNRIAETLAISPQTAKTHIYNLYKKIRVKNRAQASEWSRMYINP